MVPLSAEAALALAGPNWPKAPLLTLGQKYIFAWLLLTKRTYNLLS